MNGSTFLLHSTFIPLPFHSHSAWNVHAEYSIRLPHGFRVGNCRGYSSHVTPVTQHLLPVTSRCHVTSFLSYLKSRMDLGYVSIPWDASWITHGSQYIYWADISQNGKAKGHYFLFWKPTTGSQNAHYIMVSFFRYLTLKINLWISQWNQHQILSYNHI